MGLLTEGKPLTWHESKPYIDYVKKHGVEQFINLYNSQKDRCCDGFKWGDELEYLLVYAPSDQNIAKLSLRSAQILQETETKMNETSQRPTDPMDRVILHPEYGSFMIEATPFQPYGDSGCDLLLVERNMYKRRRVIESALNKDEYLCTLSAFPMMGVSHHEGPTHFIANIDRNTQNNGAIAQSQFIPDVIINPHPRFGALTQNIRLRRGKPVEIHVPIYRDIATPKNENSIFMDAMAFGMGNCCVQSTYQCREIDEARHLYDQLAVLTPIMMALTASTPFLKGKISDFDCRWTVIAQSVDDRTDAERKYMNKSRYDTIDCFISQCEWLDPKVYNDIDMKCDEYTYQRLKARGVDELLAKHIAHLFIRDPLVIFSDLIQLDDTASTHHFETIQSSNWQNVRFKPPPFGSDIGWRVEFRSMELQFTEFENAAFVVFITLASRAILFYGLNFYIPISAVDENFHLAHKRNSVQSERFWWRTCSSSNSKLNMKRLSIEEILIGTDECRGIVSIIESYLKVIGCSGQTLKIVNEYLTFIKKRANGTIWTNARWLREFVNKHPKYKKDSNLNDEIVRDIIDVQQRLIKGEIHDSKLLGDDISMKYRYYKVSSLNYICDPSTSPKLLSKL